MTNLLSGGRERQRHAVLGIAVHPVSANIGHQARKRLRPRSARITRAVVPHHEGKQHAHASGVEVGDHAPDPLEPAGHAEQHVDLIASVDAHIGVGWPNQHGIDAAISLLEVVQEAVDRVAPRRGVVEIAVLHHYLRLYVRALCPFQAGVVVAGDVQPHANATLGAPRPDIGEPRAVGSVIAFLPAVRQRREVQALRTVDHGLLESRKRHRRRELRFR